MEEKTTERKLTKYESLDDLTRSIEGGGSRVTGTETLESGDLRVSYYYTNGGFTDRGTNTAYFCGKCNGYYFGEAPVEQGRRYCEACLGVL